MLFLFGKIRNFIGARAGLRFGTFAKFPNEFCALKRCESFLYGNRIFKRSYCTNFYQDDAVINLDDYDDETRILKQLYVKHKYVRFLGDKYLYLKFCQEIVEMKNSSDETIIPHHLALIPYGTLAHCNEKFFVDEILPHWWNLLEGNLRNFSGRNLVSTLFCLQKIDYVVGGDVFRFLQWDRIEKIAQYSLTDVNRFNAKLFTMLLRALHKFRKAHPNESKLSNELQSSLSSAFTSYFSKDAILISDYSFSGVLYYSAKLGFLVDPNEQLKNIIPYCLKQLESKELVKTLECLSMCHRIGAALFEWNYNPGQKFWSSFYQSNVMTYDNYKFKERFCATVLKMCLLIGLKFCEEEFLKISSFWKREMAVAVQQYKSQEMNEILDLCIKKYGGSVTKIESVLSNKILNHLLNATDCYVINDDSLLKKPNSAEEFLNQNDFKYRKFHVAYYFYACRQLTYGHGMSMSVLVLSKLPESAVIFHDTSFFATNVLMKWWFAFESKLHDIPGNVLSHTLFGLTNMDNRLNGQVSKMFLNVEDHPAEKIAQHAFKDKSKGFTFESLSRILLSLEILALRHDRKLSDKFKHELAIGFNSFFEPNFFMQHSSIHTYHRFLGRILRYAKQLEIPKPPDDHLRMIVRCFSQYFYLQYVENDFNLQNQAVNLKLGADTFLYWDLDVDKYYPSFWKLYFVEIESIFVKFDRLQLTAHLFVHRKVMLLRNILLIVLQFDKEIEFECIKLFWQIEVLRHNSKFSDRDIREFFELAERCGKLERMEDILSKSNLDIFNRRMEKYNRHN